MMHKRFLRMAAAGLVAAGLSVGAAEAETVFHADFQNGKTDGWGAAGSGDIRLSSYAGNISLRLTGPVAAIAPVSTAGYADVSVSYSFAASGLGGGGACLGEASTDGGRTWQTLFRIGRGQDDGVTLHSGGGTVPGGDNDPAFRLRVRAATRGGTCWADNITVTGHRIAAAMPQAFDATGARRLLTFAELTGAATPALPVSLGAFAPPTGLAPTANRFEGRLVLGPERVPPGMRVIRDDYGDSKSADAPARHLPAFDFAFVQSGNVLIPVRRGAIAAAHPQWEFILEPGRVWDEAGDHGYSRASLPFTLEERNANCMHNGVLTFLFKRDGAISDVVYEIASETCLYAKFDMWGRLGRALCAGCCGQCLRHRRRLRVAACPSHAGKADRGSGKGLSRHRSGAVRRGQRGRSR